MNIILLEFEGACGYFGTKFQNEIQISNSSVMLEVQFSFNFTLKTNDKIRK